MNSKGEIRRSIVDLNPLIVCTLCKGYFIDPVTLVECLHSFCKTCIIKHVEKSEVCPICDTVIHKTKPFSSMREDKTLQDIVFKIVPGLHHNEMLRRKKFYATHPSKGKVPDVLERELRNKIFFNQEDKFSISIQYFDTSSSSSMKGKENNSVNGGGGGGNPNKRYLECPGPMQVCHLKKFIAMKYGLNLESFIIDIIYKDDLIPNNYTLIDIAYNYNWKKDHPMQFFYRIFKKSKVLLKRKRKTSRVEEKCSEAPHLQTEEESPQPSSPKKWKGDLGENKSNGGSLQKSSPPSNVLSPKESSSGGSEKKKSSSPLHIPPTSSLKTPSSVPATTHKVVKTLITSKVSSKSNKGSTSKDKGGEANNGGSGCKSKDPLPKIIVTSKPHPKSEASSSLTSNVVVSSQSVNPPPVLTPVVTKGGGGPSSSNRPPPTTIQTSIISKEDKNGKTLIIRKSPITSSAGVKLSSSITSAGSIISTSKITVSSSEASSKSVLKKVSVPTSSSTHHRPILPKGSTSASSEEVTKKQESSGGSNGTSDVNGNNNSEVSNNNNKVVVVTSGNNSTGSTSLSTSSSSYNHISGGSKATPNSQNNLSNIVKSLTAKKQLEDSKGGGSSSGDRSSPKGLSGGSSPKVEVVSGDKSKSSSDGVLKIVPGDMSSSPKGDKTESKGGGALPGNGVLEKKATTNAEALAQSIIANYAIAAAAQHVNAAQVLTNQLSLSRGGYQGGLEHLLRPPYVKVTDPSSLKMPIMSGSPSVSSAGSSPSSSGGGGGGSGSQIPNTNRLQFKVQASPSNSNLTSIFSSSKALPTDIKTLFGASVKKFNSNVPKALNQSIRQIPNPSLLTNKGNSSNNNNSSSSSMQKK